MKQVFNCNIYLYCSYVATWITKITAKYSTEKNENYTINQTLTITLVTLYTDKQLQQVIFVERPALAVRLDLSFRSVYFFYPGISSEPLNLPQQKFARWRQVVRNRTWRVWIFEFLRVVRLGAKNVTFCPDLPGVTFTKYNMAPKRRTISKIENCLVLAR